MRKTWTNLLDLLLKNRNEMQILDHHGIERIFKPITHVPCLTFMVIILIFVHILMSSKGIERNTLNNMNHILLGILPTLHHPQSFPYCFLEPLRTSRFYFALTIGPICLSKSRFVISNDLHEWIWHIDTNLISQISSTSKHYNTNWWAPINFYPSFLDNLPQCQPWDHHHSPILEKNVPQSSHKGFLQVQCCGWLSIIPGYHVHVRSFPNMPIPKEGDVNHFLFYTPFIFSSDDL